MSEEKKEKRYEVLFSWKKKKSNEENHVGPVIVQAKTERIAYVKATLESIKELASADLISLEVDIREF